MPSRHKLYMQIRMLFGRNRAAERLQDELRFHLDQQISENIASGMSPDDARRAAMLAFGVGTGASQSHLELVQLRQTRP